MTVAKTPTNLPERTFLQYTPLKLEPLACEAEHECPPPTMMTVTALTSRFYFGPVQTDITPS